MHVSREASEQELMNALRKATLGDYEILGELGQGGMATVYLAHEIALSRKVAIKVMSPALILSGRGMVDRFKLEARTAAALSHPHIIPIHSVRESKSLLFFVMKFVAGRSLDSILNDLGPLPLPMAIAVLNQVGSALDYAHRRGVVHRDIKPANIMMDEEGLAVVTDFGIAKAPEAHDLTMTGATVGTPKYMSPEQCGALQVTGASDQYSLGIVAYEMLAGRTPFVADSLVALMYAHCGEIPKPLAELRPDCPPHIAAAVSRMLEKAPEKRFQSIKEALTAMGAGLVGDDDLVRTQMIGIAKLGKSAALLRSVTTPASPVPKMRETVAQVSEGTPHPPSKPSVTSFGVVSPGPKSSRGDVSASTPFAARIPRWAWFVALLAVLAGVIWIASPRGPVVPSKPNRDTPSSVSSRARIDDDFRGTRVLAVGAGTACTIGYAQGGYRIDNRGTHDCIVRYPSVLPAAVRIETAFTSNSGSMDPVLLSFGTDLSGHSGYMVEIKGRHKYFQERITDAFTVFQMDQGEPGTHEIVKQTDAPSLVSRKETNSIAVDIRGSEVVVFINDIEVGRFTAAEPVKGFVSLGNKGGTTVWRYLRALPLDTPQ